MGTILVQRPCWFCKYREDFAALELQTTCKYCKGRGYVQNWYSQEVGSILLRIDPEWYKVIDRRGDDLSSDT